MTDIQLPDQEERATKTITTGYFEEELYLDAKSAGEFLIQLGEQLRDSDELTINGDGWTLPFAFGEPVELEIEFEGDGERELEIEIELNGRTKDNAPSIG